MANAAVKLSVSCPEPSEKWENRPERRRDATVVAR